MSEGSPFAVLGLTTEEEAIYRLLLQRPGESLAGLARALGTTQRPLREVTRSLEVKGLISRTTGGRPKLMAAPPELALEVLVHQRKQELDRAALSAHALAEEMKRAVGANTAAEVVEVLRGREATAQRFIQLERAAEEEILAFDKPPYASARVGNEDEAEALARGVRVRAVYDKESLKVPGQIEHLRQITDAGEHARVHPDLPMKLEIFDRKVALVPLNINEPGIEGALMIHHSPLLEALVRLFESLWAAALPVPLKREPSDSDSVSLGRGSGDTEDHPPPSDRDHVLVTLLASGLKDEAIARQLDLSVRTVKRRVRRLMDELGADTRFQAGLQAARRTWL